jgi:hypothetical protein
MARTAVIAGTATATANAVNRRQASKNMAAYESAAAQTHSQQPVQVAATPAPPEEDKYAQLERLAALKAQGILTEEEFQAEKAKILG